MADLPPKQRHFAITFEDHMNPKIGVQGLGFWVEGLGFRVYRCPGYAIIPIEVYGP